MSINRTTNLFYIVLKWYLMCKDWLSMERWIVSVYLDVDDVMGPVVLNLISTRPIFRIKISQVCDGNPMLAPKSCLQFYRGLQGVIRSFNYVPASTTSSYLVSYNRTYRFEIYLNITGYYNSFMSVTIFLIPPLNKK